MGRHEREAIRECSLAGTQRVAESGGWLGGMVPFGYGKEGSRNRLRIQVASAYVPDECPFYA